MDDNASIPIACTECHSQVTKTVQSMRDSPVLECPACGHKMTAERAAVLLHVETIRNALAQVAR